MKFAFVWAVLAGCDRGADGGGDGRERGHYRARSVRSTGYDSFLALALAGDDEVAVGWIPPGRTAIRRCANRARGRWIFGPVGSKSIDEGVEICYNNQ